ncbi:hypothetical protein [Photobacterium phosphoreum]|nr:hypothetical protein [Photobacterium phosphoreum]
MSNILIQRLKKTLTLEKQSPKVLIIFTCGMPGYRSYPLEQR